MEGEKWAVIENVVLDGVELDALSAFLLEVYGALGTLDAAAEVLLTYQESRVFLTLSRLLAQQSSSLEQLMAAPTLSRFWMALRERSSMQGPRTS